MRHTIISERGLVLFISYQIGLLLDLRGRSFGLRLKLLFPWLLLILFQASDYSYSLMKYALLNYYLLLFQALSNVWIKHYFVSSDVTYTY